MYIYEIINIKNLKRYIGQSIERNNRRLNTHRYLLNANKHYNPHLQSAWNKYTSDFFMFNKIEFCNSLKELNTAEAKWISYYKSDDRKYGYNVKLGGENFGKIADETKKKIGNANRGNHHTSYQRAKWAKEKRLNDYPRYVISPDGRRYKVDNVRGFCKIHNIDRSNFMQMLKKDVIHSKGWRLPGVSKKLCVPGVMSSIKQRKYKYPKFISPDGKIVAIETTLNSFCRENNLDPVHIRSIINGKRHHHKGWKVYNKENNK